MEQTTIEQLRIDLIDLIDDLKSTRIYTDKEKEVIKTRIFFLSSALQNIDLYNKI